MVARLIIISTECIDLLRICPKRNSMGNFAIALRPQILVDKKSFQYQRCSSRSNEQLSYQLFNDQNFSKKAMSILKMSFYLSVPRPVLNFLWREQGER